MTQWYGAVLGVLAASGLLMLAVELRKRIARRRRWTRRSESIFRLQRNGRVRFHLEDLRRSATSAARRRLRPELESTIPDLDITIPDLEVTVPDVLGRRLPRQRLDQPDW